VRRARIKWRIPGGNAVAERARPRSGRGAAERRDRLCRKPGARRSWGDEPRYTMKITGAYGGVADSGAVPRTYSRRRLPSEQIEESSSAPARHAAQRRAKQPARSAAIAARPRTGCACRRRFRRSRQESGSHGVRGPCS
jgi:hypothetical protein